jgi:hypothetical protein
MYVAFRRRTANKKQRAIQAKNTKRFSRKKDKPAAEKGGSEKTIIIDITDNDGEVGAQGQAFSGKVPLEKSKESVPATPSAFRAFPATPSAFQVSPATPSAPQSALSAADVISPPSLHQVEVLRTKISPFGPTKFVYVEDAATIPDFLETVRKKWALSPLSRATGILVFMNGQEFCIDITEGRDWDMVKRILSNGSGFADVLVHFTD